MIYFIKITSILSSDYFRQKSSVMNFKSDSWVVLSGIEQGIKKKIERIGTPLKDLDVNIYRGILTGYNEAFIIDENTKNELVEKSGSTDLSEIIRPILRGRDIQKYKADWQNLYLINTFPSLKIEINNYPIIKEHLLSFNYDRLKQTGETGARKKTSNKWFETQDQIGYWQDFDKPKIIWKRIGSVIRFSYDESKTVCLDSTCFATGNDLKFLLGFLNSTISKRELLNNAPKTGTGDVITSVQALEPLLIPKINENIKNEIIKLVDICLNLLNINENHNIRELENEIDKLFFESFGFNIEEKDHILNSKIN